jgi:glycosyltransferase involved in cell wall biosynthesis
VTVNETTFPKRSRKLVAIGQAIDVDRFAVERVPHEGFRALVIGRYSPAKGVDTIIRAAASAGGRLDVYGPEPNDEARRERARLQALVDGLGASERVELHGALTRAQVVEELSRADVLLNNAPGGADRIVYEAAAAGVPVLASNRAHEDVLDREAFFPRDDASALRAKLAALTQTDPRSLVEQGRRLRRRVRASHSVDSWAEGVVRAAGLTAP